MTCTNCGWKNPATVTFCRKCGALLTSRSEESQISSSASATSARKDAKPVLRTRRKATWRLLWLLCACLLIAGAGITWWLVSTPQSTAAISQTLQTYCHALQSGDYQQAYNQWASSTKMNEADFAYVQNNKGKITTCEVSNIAENNASAQAKLAFSYANGNTIVDQLDLVLEQGKWKIKGQSAS